MPNALLVYPKSPITFWSYETILDMIDKAAAMPPLGLLTVAGMIPDTYRMRLVDLNICGLQDTDLDWADIVITSSMIIHWASLEDIIARCNARGVPILNGGPLPTEYHDQIEGRAVFYLGEAENGFMDVVEQMLANPKDVTRRYVDRRGQFRDLSETPLPRWDLIDFDAYINMVIQMPRGCPESCTFCNIPSLYGKTTRLKSKSRIIEELEALYEAGWRGYVMAVDDNFIGNRQAIHQLLLEDVIPWQKAHGYPFRFYTQLSIRVSDDPDLLDAMYEAGFDKVFIGIESPADESLKFMGAQKNLQGHDASLVEKVKTVQRFGMEVQAGFILGLDTDPEDIADRMIAFIREAGIPMAMVGILNVLRGTPDHKRFARQGRLVHRVKYVGHSGIFNPELNFVPLIEPRELFARHRQVLTRINSPDIFFERCRTHFRHLGRRPVSAMPRHRWQLRIFFRSIWRQGVKKGYRRAYWAFLADMLWHDPKRFPAAVSFAIQGYHLITVTRDSLRQQRLPQPVEERDAADRLEAVAQKRSA